MFSRRFARSLCTGLALGTMLATFGCAPAPNDASDDDGEGGAGDPKGGSGGKKAGGSGGKTGAGGSSPDDDNGGSGGTSSGSGGKTGSGGTSGGDGGTSGGDGGSGGKSSGSGGTSGGDGGSGGTSSGAGGTVGGGSGGTSGGAVTFTELYDAIFNVAPPAASSCWGANCHNPGVKDKVDMSTKAKAYTTILAKVKAGMPATSALITRLESKDVKMRMPLNKPALDAAVIAKVKAWIMAGAKND
jgi:hypothetical protein